MIYAPMTPPATMSHQQPAVAQGGAGSTTDFVTETRSRYNAKTPLVGATDRDAWVHTHHWPRYSPGVRLLSRVGKGAVSLGWQGRAHLSCLARCA